MLALCGPTAHRAVQRMRPDCAPDCCATAARRITPVPLPCAAAPQTNLTEAEVAGQPVGVHQGIAESLDEVYGQLVDKLDKFGAGPGGSSNLIITGHSLGGSLSALAAVRLAADGFNVSGERGVEGAALCAQQAGERSGAARYPVSGRSRQRSAAAAAPPPQPCTRGLRGAWATIALPSCTATWACRTRRCGSQGRATLCR